MWLTIVLLALAAFIIWKSIKPAIEAQKAGIIVKRNLDFAEETEEFTLKDADFAKVIAALERSAFGQVRVTLKGSARDGVVNFTSTSWTAQLVPTKSEAGTYSYAFSFTHWESQRGQPTGIFEMNMVLTTLEKMFLDLDLATKVETWKNDIKSTLKFF